MCFLYDLHTKFQLLEWKSNSSPWKQKFCLDKCKGKAMLEIFYSHGIVRHEFIQSAKPNSEPRKYVLVSFVIYRTQSERNFLKHGKQKIVSFYMTLSHTGQGIHSTALYIISGAYTITLLIWHLPIFICLLAWNQFWKENGTRMPVLWCSTSIIGIWMPKQWSSF